MKTATINGDVIHYRDLGEDDAPAILWGHGFMLASHLYAEVATLLPGYRHIIPDLRGHGESAKADTDPTLRRMADDLWELANLLGLREFGYVGHSMGNAVGVRLAARHPAAVRAGVSIAGIPVTGKLEETREDVATLADVAGDGSAIAQVLAGLFVREAPDSQLVAACGKSGSLVPGEVVSHITSTEFYLDESAELLPGLTQPWLFLVPTEDTTEPEHHQISQASLLPDSTVVRLPGEGHMVPQENPAAVAGPIRDFFGAVARP
ncbi:alpha/beta fold hydrolase [Amycolatopsis thermoflava]|uniref:alpha/beta fold hydrolase n=1 Tax=Amycolatopsis thermoflava TaxID=84480 RepID=UPI003654326F